MSRFASIPFPQQEDPTSMQASILALKESVEILTAQRGSRATGIVTFQDLVDLGLIAADQIPTTPIT